MRLVAPRTSANRRNRTNPKHPSLLLLLFTLLSCGGDVIGVVSSDGSGNLHGTGFRPVSIQKVSGDQQVAEVGSHPADPLVIRVFGGNQTPLPGVEVTWSVVGGGGSLYSAATETDRDGFARQHEYVIGKEAGQNDISATVSGLPPAAFQILGIPGPPKSLTVGPDPLRLWVGRSGSLTAEVKDAWGNDVAASPTWSVANSDLILVSEDGTVKGLSVGATTVTAIVGPFQATASVEVALFPTASLSLIEGTGQEGEVDQLLSAPLVLRVVDENGVPVPGHPLEWTFISGSGTVFPGGSRDSLAASIQGYSDDVGLASVLWHLGTGAGVQEAIATVSGSGAQLTFSALAGPGAPHRIELTPSPVSLPMSSKVQLNAEAFDKFENPVPAGFPLQWIADSSGVASVDADGMVRGEKPGQGQVRAVSGSATGTALVTVEEPTSIPPPSRVTDLRVSSTTESSITLQWTQVDDGDGQPAGYTLRRSDPPIDFDLVEETQLVILGTGIGETIAAEWTGLAPSSTSDFQLRSFRGAPGPEAAVGELSNVATGVTGVPAPQVASLEVAPSSISFTAVNQTEDLTASAFGPTGQSLSGVGVYWVSSGPSVALVDQSGRVTSKGAGHASIIATASCCNVSDTVPVSVSLAPIPTTVEVSPASFALEVGTNQRLSAQVLDQNGSPMPGVGITWSSANPFVAGVNEWGTVWAGKTGTTTITGRAGAAAGTVTVTVIAVGSNLAPGSVEISPSSLALEVGQTQRITAEVFDQHGSPMPGETVTWSSDSPLIAGVNEWGTVWAGKPGTARIRATAGAASGTITVTVSAATFTPVPTSVSVSPSAVSLDVGENRGLTAEVRDQNGSLMQGEVVTWSSTNSGVASVSQSGTVSGAAAGSATIRAQAGSATGSAAITVTAVSTDPVPTSVTVSPASVALEVGENQRLNAEVRDQNGDLMTGTTVSWSSANPQVAGVNEWGTTWAGKVGTTTITARAGTASGTATVTVSSATSTPVATSVSVSPSALSLDVGENRGLTAEVRDQNGSLMPGASVTWSSADPGVAGVSQSGTVSGAAAGTTTVTAHAGSATGSAAITVTAVSTDPVPTSVTVSPASVALEVGENQRLTAEVRDQNGDLMTGTTVSWSSADPQTAGVNEWGTTWAGKVGTTTITARAGTASGTATVTVSAATSTPVPTSVSVSPSALSIDVGQYYGLTAEVRDQNGSLMQGEAVTWSSTNPGVASVNQSGTVSGAAAGSATIRAQAGSVSGTAAVTVSTPSSSEPFFSDGFESGNLNRSQNGFSWGRNWESSVEDTRAKSGSHSVRFRFEAANDPGNQEAPASFSELRFDLGSLKSEVFLEYDLYIPSNFAHRDHTPGNNKWLLIWGDGSYPSSHVAGGPMLISTNSYRSTDSGVINYLHPVWNDQDQVSGGPDADPFITTADRGRWIRLRWHFRVSQSSTSQDAVIRLWKDGTLVLSKTGFNLWSPSGNGFRNGYLMGWHSAGYDQETHIYVDNFKVYTSNPGW